MKADLPRILLLVALAGVASATLVGCSPGHGEYTGTFKKDAELRLANLKAATEWDRAKAQYLSGNLEKALETADKCIAYNDQVANGFILRGRILLEMGRLEPALKALEHASALDASNAEAHYFRGVVYERISRNQQAYDAYMQADGLDPSNAQYLLAAAEMLIETNRLDEVWTLLNERQSDFEHNAGIRQTMGHVASMRGDNERAIVLFQEAHLLAPDDPSLLEDLARAQAAGGRFAEAESNLRLVLARPEASERRDIKHLYVQCLMELDRPVDARTILQELVRQEGGTNDIEAWVELGNIACILEDGFRLREAAAQLVAIAPRRHEGHLFMAMWNRSQGRLEAALEATNKAVLFGRDEAGPLALRGLIEMELGRYDASLMSLEAALALDPRDASLQRLVEHVNRVHQGG